MNPNRTKTLDHKIPPDVPVIAVITHLPCESEYHEKRREIVEAAVLSAKKNAGIDAHFVIFDNGSHYDLQRWLVDLHPDRLILSRNVGKMNAVHALCSMYPGSIISISDDDILHYKNWIQPQINILKAFRAFLVSGVTTRHYMKYQHLVGYGDMLGIAAADATSEIETPLEWDIQHGYSIGKDPRISRDMQRVVRPLMLHKDGVSALVGGNHCQFVGYADGLRQFFVKTDMYMQPLYPVDCAIDGAGYLRLLTPERRARHLGNVLSNDDVKEIYDIVDGWKYKQSLFEMRKEVEDVV
jgi:hypothetical protein